MMSCLRTQKERLHGFLSQAVFLEVFTADEAATLRRAAELGELDIEAFFTEHSERLSAAVWPRFERLHAEAWAAPPAAELRFAAGDRVLMRAPGGAWQPAVVVQRWYREEDWPPAFLAPYQLRLEGEGTDEDLLCYAPVDSDSFVRSPDTPEPPRSWTDPALNLGWSCIPATEAAQFRANGMSALHFSCMRGDPDSVARLLRRPTADNQPGSQNNPLGDSPLHACVQGESVHCAMLCLAAGADPRSRNRRGMTAAQQCGEHYGGLKCEFEQAALVGLLRRFEEAVNAQEAA